MPLYCGNSLAEARKLLFEARSASITGRLQLGEPLIEFPLCTQGDAEVGVGLGVAGLEPDRRTEFSDRLLRLPLGQQDVAEVVVGHDVVGLEADGGAVFGDRLLRLPLG